MSSNFKVAAVLVTYGNRWIYLESVLKCLLTEQKIISDIIVIDNSSHENIQEKVKGFDSNIIQVLRLKENTGSAMGFKTGIETAVNNTSADFLWLLDDDNKPKKGALASLLAAYEMMGKDPSNTFVSLRRERKEFLFAATWGQKVEIRRNSFLGFHFRDLVWKVGNRLRQEIVDQKDFSFPFPLISVSNAPYGGFLFHRCWVERVGLPDDDFYIYCDDYEFSSRFVSNDGQIYLCALSEIEDIDISWNRKKIKSHRLISPESDSVRLYYSIRNRVYLESKKYVDSPLLYSANMVFFMVLLFCIGLIRDASPLATIKRFRILLEAVKDGKNGKLGRVAGQSL